VAKLHTGNVPPITHHGPVAVFGEAATGLGDTTFTMLVELRDRQRELDPARALSQSLQLE
jgi:hypothetical protein